MQGTLQVTKAEGPKLLEKKYNVTYKVIFTQEPEKLIPDLKKTVEDKIKNLALLSEKLPIDSGMFLQLVRQQLSAEVGKYGIRLIDLSLQTQEIDTQQA